MRTRLTARLPWALAGALFALAVGLHLHTAFAAASPEDAVRESVQARGERFTGDCAQTVSPRDVGGVCFRLVEERAGTRAYLVGRTFSEFSRWVFVAPSGAGWTVVDEQALDFFAQSLEIPWP